MSDIIEIIQNNGIVENVIDLCCNEIMKNIGKDKLSNEDISNIATKLSFIINNVGDIGKINSEDIYIIIIKSIKIIINFNYSKDDKYKLLTNLLEVVPILYNCIKSKTESQEHLEITETKTNLSNEEPTLDIIHNIIGELKNNNTTTTQDTPKDTKLDTTIQDIAKDTNSKRNRILLMLGNIFCMCLSMNKNRNTNENKDDGVWV